MQEIFEHCEQAKQNIFSSNETASQPTFTCLNSTVETPEQCVKYARI